MAAAVPYRRGGGPRRFGSKIEAFQSRVAVYWCLRCNRRAGQEVVRGKTVQRIEMQCSSCGSKAHYFASTGEFKRWAHLNMLQNAGEITRLRVQTPFAIVINGIKVCEYRSDADYYDREGRWVVEEYKGNAAYQDETSKLRRRLAEVVYGINILSLLKHFVQFKIGYTTALVKHIVQFANLGRLQVSCVPHGDRQSELQNTGAAGSYSASRSSR